MKECGLVSVIIPTYNPDKYIFRSLESALQQTYSPVEIIVVDDGSIIDCKAILGEYISTRKIIYLKKENGGPSIARNYGIFSAKGEVICFLDDDDYWYPTKLQAQLDALIERNCSLVLCDSHEMNFITNTKSLHHVGLPENKIDAIRKIYSGEVTGFTSGILVRKAVLAAVLFDEELKRREDHFFLMQCIKNFDYCCLDVPLYMRNKREAGLSVSVTPQVLLDNMFVLEKKCRREFPFLTQRDFINIRSYVFKYNINYFLKRTLRLEAIKNNFRYIMHNPFDYRLYVYQILLFLPVKCGYVLDIIKWLTGIKQKKKSCVYRLMYLVTIKFNTFFTE